MLSDSDLSDWDFSIELWKFKQVIWLLVYRKPTSIGSRQVRSPKIGLTMVTLVDLTYICIWNVEPFELVPSTVSWRAILVGNMTYFVVFRLSGVTGCPTRKPDHDCKDTVRWKKSGCLKVMWRNVILLRGSFYEQFSADALPTPFRPSSNQRNIVRRTRTRSRRCPTEWYCSHHDVVERDVAQLDSDHVSCSWSERMSGAFW